MHPTTEMMPSFPPFPNKHQRRIIVLMLSKNMNFDGQDCYSNKKAFKRAMDELHSMGIVVCRRKKNGNNWVANEYKLTPQGEHLGVILNALSKIDKK